MKNPSSAFLVLLLCGWAAVASAQYSGGFIAGMNFSKTVGPSEVDDNGRELEEFTFKTGFHVGGRFSYQFDNPFGLRAELMYTQKGTQYSYNGQSYWIFRDDDENLIYSTGTRDVVLKVVQNYLEVPLMAYARFGRLEIGGGAYFAYLFQATGAGELIYSGVSENDSPIDPFTIALDFNYFNDGFERTDVGETQTVIVDGEALQVPLSIGSQFEALAEPEQRLYNRTDLGLIGNLAVYLNQGLSLGFRVNYGLQDQTRTDVDVAKASLNPDKSFIFRDDFDRNLTLQASIAFNF